MLESTRSAKSHTVTLCTRFFNPSAHFRPISPAPTIKTRLVLVTASSSAKASSTVKKLNFCKTVSSPFIGGTNGLDPVATQTSLYKSCSPLERVTVFSLGFKAVASTP